MAPRPAPPARRHGGLPRPDGVSTLESSSELRTVLRRSSRAVSSVVSGSPARAALSAFLLVSLVFTALLSLRGRPRTAARRPCTTRCSPPSPPSP